MPKETPGTVWFIEINTTRKVEIVKSSIWFRPLASSSAVLAGLGALVVVAPLTDQGNSIAKSVSSPAYALLSHNDIYDNENDADGTDDVHINGTHVEEVHGVGTHVDDVASNPGTHVEEVHGVGTHVDDVASNPGTHVEEVHGVGTHVDDVASNPGTHVEEVHVNGTNVAAVSDFSGANLTSYAAPSLNGNQTLVQPRLRRKTNTIAAAPITSGSSPVVPAVSVAVTATSAAPATPATNESRSSVNRASESVSVPDNGTSTRSKVRSSRSSAARR